MSSPIARLVAARGRHRFADRRALAKEVRQARPGSVGGGDCMGRAEAPASRGQVEVTRGTLTTRQSPETVRICAGFPAPAGARRHG